MYAQRVPPELAATDFSAASEPSVEFELSSGTPRRVVDSKFLREWRLGCANVVAGTLLGTWYLYTHLLPMPEGLLWMCLFFAGAFSLCWVAHEVEASSDRKLLRYGDVMRATVEQHYIISGGWYPVHMIICTYKRRDGRLGTGSLNVLGQIAESCGGFAVGQQFTLLSYPDDPDMFIPYFKVAYATIPGAAPARTSPPCSGEYAA